jgi:beta-lactamase regulating signal transducer with metallopeptidase domain
LARQNQARLYQADARRVELARDRHPTSLRGKAFGVLMAFVVALILWGGIIWAGAQVAAAISG